MRVCQGLKKPPAFADGFEISYVVAIFEKQSPVLTRRLLRSECSQQHVHLVFSRKPFVDPQEFLAFVHRTEIDTVAPERRACSILFSARRWAWSWGMVSAFGEVGVGVRYIEPLHKITTVEYSADCCRLHPITWGWR
jgi:hypothetical protein